MVKVVVHRHVWGRSGSAADRANFGWQGRAQELDPDVWKLFRGRCEVWGRKEFEHYDRVDFWPKQKIPTDTLREQAAVRARSLTDDTATVPPVYLGGPELARRTSVQVVATRGKSHFGFEVYGVNAHPTADDLRFGWIKDAADQAEKPNTVILVMKVEPRWKRWWRRIFGNMGAPRG